jgi:hypothetical protein
MYASMVHVVEPFSLHEALDDPNASRWRTTLDIEYHSMMKNTTWIMVD